jgi:hypothetical protein
MSTENVEALTSHNPMGLHDLLQGLCYYSPTRRKVGNGGAGQPYAFYSSFQDTLSFNVSKAAIRVF